MVTLFDEHGEFAVTGFDDEGFAFPLDRAGRYRLEVVYEGELLTVEDLNIG